MREKKERNLKMVELYKPYIISLTDVGRRQKPPISKQAVHVILKRYNQTTHNGNLRGLWGRVVGFIKSSLSSFRVGR